MRKERGEIAPDFQASTIDNEIVRLSHFAGKPVWLSFFRYAACPLCSFRVHELLGHWDRFAGYDFELLTVWQSSPQKLEEIRQRYSPTFRIIADPKMDLYHTYGVETSATGAFSKDVLRGMAGARQAGISMFRMWEGPPTRVPADFLIDAQGVIRLAFYGRNVADQVPFETVEQFLSGDLTFEDDRMLSEEVAE